MFTLLENPVWAWRENPRLFDPPTGAIPEVSLVTYRQEFQVSPTPSSPPDRS